jgi:hypothetical protein
MQIVPLWTPKSGSEEGEYEDSYAFSVDRVAVADGASEGIFCRLWADLLTKHIVHANICLKDFRDFENFKEWLRRMQDEWREAISEQYRVESLPWYVKDKLRQVGAYSTLLALEFKEGERGRKSWLALSVGDVCLFKIKFDKLVLSFPLSRSDDFTISPPLISSRFLSSVHKEDVKFAEGELDTGETLIVATDAFSQWFLKMHENGEKPWALLSTISNNEAFRALMDKLRDAGEMRNDDVTVLMVTID